MRSRECTTMYVDFAHVMRFNDILQKAIAEEYLRWDWSFFSILVRSVRFGIWERKKRQLWFAYSNLGVKLVLIYV